MLFCQRCISEPHPAIAPVSLAVSLSLPVSPSLAGSLAGSLAEQVEQSVVVASFQAPVPMQDRKDHLDWMSQKRSKC